MSSDLEIGVSEDFVSNTDTASGSQDQIEKIRKQVAKLQGIERGISKKGRMLTDDKADPLKGTARTARDSLHFSRQGSLHEPEGPDESVQKIHKEVRRLQDLQQGLADGGNKSSKILRTVADMSLTPEQFEKQQKYTRARKYSAIALGFLTLAGVLGCIVALVSFMQDKNVSFSKEKGGNTPQTLQEVGLHATTDDCWASIHGNVYDLTEWVNDHPGGSIYIQSICGIDGTDLYSTIADHPSEWLKVFVAEYRVGPLEAATEMPAQETTDKPASAAITLDVVALHNTPQDMWVALWGDVYDLTQWANIHQGGSRHINDMAGTDGTAMFARHHGKLTLNSVVASKLGPLAA